MNSIQMVPDVKLCVGRGSNLPLTLVKTLYPENWFLVTFTDNISLSILLTPNYT